MLHALLMAELYNFRCQVFIAASEFYRAHGDYLADLRQYGQARSDVWKNCMAAGNNYQDALTTFLQALTSSELQEQHEEATRSTEHLLLSLKYRLAQLRDEQPIRLASLTKRKQWFNQLRRVRQFLHTVAPEEQHITDELSRPMSTECLPGREPTNLCHQQAIDQKGPDERLPGLALRIMH